MNMCPLLNGYGNIYIDMKTVLSFKRQHEGTQRPVCTSTVIDRMFVT